VTDAAGQIRAELARAARVLGVDDAEPIITRPNDPAFGDWATNLAMLLSRPLKQKPRDVAEKLIAAMDKAAAGVSSAEIAGPGFINFRVDQAQAAQGLKAIIGAGATFGRSVVGKGKPVNIEFVSANPTGPLHVGHGRQAAIGDALASLLEWTGWNVTREFYYNDAGAQIDNLALSVQARARDMSIPEGGYHGEYIREIAEQYKAEHPTDRGAVDLQAIREFAVKYLRREQDLDLQAFGVKFDVYYLESSLYADGKVEQTIERLKQAGHTFEQDGALWLRTTDYGDDKDRVVVRSKEKGGTPTYFVPDVAYHVTKWQRGFTRAINVQGSDHHGTTARVRAGLQALDIGVPAGYPEYVLHQMVTVMRGGEEVKISKRAGSYVTVRDLIDEVGRDAVRYFFLMRKGDSQLTFDVDLARTQSEENPVYYIQMAHARLSGIFRVGGIDPAGIDASASLEPLTLPEEQELIKALVDFPSIVQGAAAALEPHRIANYLHDLAARTHLWYHKAHVLNEPDEIMRARLVVARAAQIVLKNGLSMLGISAPERM
jgi:arginyl-tRNA synthetase